MKDYENILLLIDHKKYDLAINALNHRVSISPNDERVYYLLSICYFQKENIEQARFYIEKAIELNPNETYILNHYSKIEIEQENYGNALELIDKSLYIDPKEEDTFNLKARVYIEKGKVEEAIDCAKQALKIDGSNSLAKNIIILGEIINKSYYKSEDKVKLLLNEDPTNEFTLANFALLKFYTNKIEESIDIFKSILRINPNNKYIKAWLKISILSRNNFLKQIIRFNQFSQKHEKTVRLIIGITYRIFLVVAYFIYLGSKNDSFNFLVTYILIVYTILTIPYKIIPQLANLLLLKDSIGRFLIDKKEKIASLITLTFFSVGVFMILCNFYNVYREENYKIFVFGLSMIFISSLSFDFLLFDNIKKQITILIFGLILLGFVILNTVKTDISILVFITLIIYPFIIKIIKEE